VTLSEAVRGYAKFEQIHPAEQYMQQMMDMMVTTTTSNDNTNSNTSGKVRDASSQRENSSAPQEHPNSYYSNTGLVAQAAHCMMNAYVTVCQKQKTASGRSDVVEKAQALFLQLDRDKVITHTGGTTLRTCVCVGAVQRRSLNLCVRESFGTSILSSTYTY
jgi:hypothetical protein